MRTIFTGYAPTESLVQVKTALSLFLPNRWSEWRTFKHSSQVEAWFANQYHVKQAHTIDSGRAAIQLVLEALHLKPGDEVLVQAYTCLVVVNAICWAGGTPVFVDVLDNTTMDVTDAACKITNRTKAILIQHTFGFAADMPALLALAKKNHLFTIEDCAHAIGVYDKENKLLGSQGDAAIFSFGSDKVVSSGRGGIIVTKHQDLNQKLRKRIAKLPIVPRWYTATHLLRVVWFYYGKATYHLGIGKWLMAAMAKLGLSNPLIYPNEKKGEGMSPFPARWPSAFAALVLPQLMNLDKIQAARKRLVLRYEEEINNPNVRLAPGASKYPLIRLPAFVEDPQAWHKAAQKQGIFLGYWYDAVISPDERVVIEKYTPGSCPNAERLAAQTINFPTGPRLTPAEQGKVIAFINSFQP